MLRRNNLLLQNQLLKCCSLVTTYGVYVKIYHWNSQESAEKTTIFLMIVLIRTLLSMEQLFILITFKAIMDFFF